METNTFVIENIDERMTTKGEVYFSIKAVDENKAFSWFINGNERLEQLGRKLQEGDTINIQYNNGVDKPFYTIKGDAVERSNVRISKTATNTTKESDMVKCNKLTNRTNLMVALITDTQMGKPKDRYKELISLIEG